VTGRLDAWLLAPAPAARLATFRVLVGLFATVYLAIRSPAFWALASPSGSARFEPVGVLWFLDAPLPGWSVRLAVAAVLALGVAFTIGFRFRLAGPAFAVVLLALSTYRSSWGQILWLENLMVLHVLVLAGSRAADGRDRPDDAAYGWPLRLAALVTVTTYVLAGVAKLRIGGIDWMTGDSVRNQVAYSAARLDLLGATGSPVGRWLVRYAWVFPPAAVATVVLELGAPLALLGGRVRTAWVGAMWALHLSIAVLMLVVFPYPIALVAFAPLFRLERLADRVASARWWRRPKVAT
jgi:Vitamin K-dependent gamma-carboxylase